VSEEIPDKEEIEKAVSELVFIACTKCGHHWIKGDGPRECENCKQMIDLLKEVLADGDRQMGETGVMAGAHWNAIKRKIKELENGNI
jgi:hypothetical protein